MDNLNELGKNLRKVRSDTDTALRRDYPLEVQFEQARDTFDYEIPFEMEFYVDRLINVALNLTFFLPLSSKSTCCCGGCVCAQCDVFIDEGSVLITTYEMVSGTEHLFVNDQASTNFTINSSTQITLGFTPAATDVIKICYITVLVSALCS